MRHEQVVDVDAEFGGIEAVEGVLRVDERCDTASFLAFGDGVYGQRGFTGRLGAVDFDDTTAWEAADAEGGVEADAACGDDVELLLGAVAKPHDGAFAVVFLNLVERTLQYFQFFLPLRIHVGLFFCHNLLNI